MAGLMKPGKEAAPAQQGGEESNVSPEEQEQYNAFVANGMNLIYEEKGLQNMVKSLDGDGNPVGGLANTLVNVVSRLEGSAEQSGKPIDDDVLYHGSVELLEQLAEMAEKANVHEFSEEDLESALYLALDQYREAKQQQGKLPEDGLKSDFQQIMQAEQNGTLNDILPGVEEYAQRAPKPDQAQET